MKHSFSMHSFKKKKLHIPGLDSEILRNSIFFLFHFCTDDFGNPGEILHGLNTCQVQVKHYFGWHSYSNTGLRVTGRKKFSSVSGGPVKHTHLLLCNIEQGRGLCLRFGSVSKVSQKQTINLQMCINYQPLLSFELRLFCGFVSY